jgi:hypothetical protein
MRRQFDFDYFSAEVREQSRCHWSSKILGQIDNPDTFENLLMRRHLIDLTPWHLRVAIRHSAAPLTQTHDRWLTPQMATIKVQGCTLLANGTHERKCRRLARRR